MIPVQDFHSVLRFTFFLNSIILERRILMLRKRKLIKSGTEQSISTPSVEETTIIGERISIEGNIQGEGDLIIDGTVKGGIGLNKHHLTVGSKGRVEADIHAENVTISGRMTGNIKAGCKVEITKEADFNGEIRAKRISVEDGAYLKAVIELERERREKKVPVEKPTAEVEFPKPDQEPLTLVSGPDKGK
jgi:cytoskeletal protein CcmA (bactofilin family)